MDNLQEPGQTYICELCGGSFLKGWSDKDAEQEAKNNFGLPQDSMAIVCDDCFKKIMEGTTVRGLSLPPGCVEHGIVGLIIDREILVIGWEDGTEARIPLRRPDQITPPEEE
jgi:hypothetical protein